MISINQNQYITYEQMNLINDFRALWTELVIWMRSYMVSTITGFSDLNSITNRLYRIPVQLKDRLQAFLGVECAEQFQRLLSTYLFHAQAIVAAEKNNDQQGVDAAVKELYAVSDIMADYLARTNPYWNRNQWQSLFYQLSEMGISEIVAIYSGDYESEINLRDQLLKHALILGDYMASGVMHYLAPEIQKVNKRAALFLQK